MIFLELMRLEFLFKLTPDTTLKYKEEKDGGRNVYKDRIAVLAGAGLDRTERGEIVVTGKRKNLRRF